VGGGPKEKSISGKVERGYQGIKKLKKGLDISNCLGARDTKLKSGERRINEKGTKRGERGQGREGRNKLGRWGEKGSTRGRSQIGKD